MITEVYGLKCPYCESKKIIAYKNEAGVKVEKLSCKDCSNVFYRTFKDGTLSKFLNN